MASGADLRARLKASRFPSRVEGVGWDDGTDAGLLRQWVTHRAERFDWRTAERNGVSFDVIISLVRNHPGRLLGGTTSTSSRGTC
ncbi:epoxide hydrolase domain-containing protein [Myxococcus stipitatus DSM 14675]|uniref:Epoxide hydrolase domain-containing protein n=1 Tax=Myxococcus stipitatus (strain DSM 14675 / JCM 12634 / Mx s8) TaxID=1278073 RepID=L7U5V3_MYXSD|nr:epoxide hydrolase domain-containing protein [Myxococcus stipitatus DSM 14675]